MQMSIEMPDKPIESSPEIVDLQERIAKASADSEAWRAAGHTENYLASFLLMEALEARLFDVHARAAAHPISDGNQR